MPGGTAARADLCNQQTGPEIQSPPGLTPLIIPVWGII